MQRPWFKLIPGDENFLRSAPGLMVDTMEIGQSADAVWADLTSDETRRRRPRDRATRSTG